MSEDKNNVLTPVQRASRAAHPVQSGVENGSGSGESVAGGAAPVASMPPVGGAVQSPVSSGGDESIVAARESTDGNSTVNSPDNPGELPDAVVTPKSGNDGGSLWPTFPEADGGGNLVSLLEARRDAAKAAQLTPEELKRRARRRRVSMVIGSIGDVSSAIANLVATTQYAPNAKQPKQSIAGALKSKYDAMDAAEEKARKELNELEDKLGKAKDDESKHKWEVKARKAAHDLKVIVQKNAERYREWLKKFREEQEANRKAYQEEKLKNDRRRVAAAEKNAESSRIRANKSGKKSGGSTKTVKNTVVRDENGKLVGTKVESTTRS